MWIQLDGQHIGGVPRVRRAHLGADALRGAETGIARSTTWEGGCERDGSLETVTERTWFQNLLRSRFKLPAKPGDRPALCLEIESRKPTMQIAEPTAQR